MSAVPKSPEILDSGTLQFTIESRILRELGERLVKQPEVALLELVKNAYDADATFCEIVYNPPGVISIGDDGHGMTLNEFKNGWMRIGTSSKEISPLSRQFERIITGEKGIGRFAVRFLGKALHLESVAYDAARAFRTLLTADFDWPTFDQNEDLGKIRVPFQLVAAARGVPNGTRLVISSLQANAAKIDLYSVRTSSIGVVTPYQALLKTTLSDGAVSKKRRKDAEHDPGFTLKILPASEDANDGDVAKAVLDSYVLRSVVELRDDRLNLTIYRKGEDTPTITINDRFVNTIGPLYADIRFFPQRKGTFTGLGVDGRKAKTWVKDHSGIAVFDRTFRVHPYGFESDDWLFLSADTAKRAREPRSTIAKKHFQMDDASRASTQLNYMLRLPYPQQLVGVVQVVGRRTREQSDENGGLIAAADREGFVHNKTFDQLWHIIRGAVEGLASADRELQLDQERLEQTQLLQSLRKETREAIREIESNPNIAGREKAQIVSRLAQTLLLAEKHEEESKEREATLEVMSLLGVVAGFMTHEFGIALDELQRAQGRLLKLARRDESFKDAATALANHIKQLEDFVTYTRGYIQGTSSVPERPYPARARIQQVKRVFGKYAADRNIDVRIEIEGDVLAPLVPVSLYNGIALNLFTNALKAVTAKIGKEGRTIVFRAWNEQQWHYLEVSDTGIGIPNVLRHRVFDPLFTTTGSNRDPLGSGMGLGLALVKRGVDAYGGRIDVVDPPPAFTTCFRVRLPLGEEL